MCSQELVPSGVGWTDLLHHLVLLVEELHLNVATHGQRLRELKEHVLLFPSGVHRVGGVDLNLQLVHDKLRVWKEEEEEEEGAKHGWR